MTDDELVSAYHACLTRNSVIIILDDISGAQLETNTQYFPSLLPGHSCNVLMVLTSRERCSLLPAAWLKTQYLEGLNGSDAISLGYSLSGSATRSVIQEQIERLKEPILPLAILWIVSILNDPFCGGEESIWDIKTSQLKELFQVQSARLIPESRVVLHASSLFEDPFNEEELAYVLEMNISDIRNHLKILFQQTLIQYDKRKHWFYLHDVVKQFVFLTSVAKENWSRRFIEYFRQLLDNKAADDPALMEDILSVQKAVNLAMAMQQPLSHLLEQFALVLQLNGRLYMLKEI